MKVFAAAPSISAHHITIWLSIFGHHKNLPSADSKPLCYFFHTIPHNYVRSIVTPCTGTVIFCFLLFVICQYQWRKCKNPSSMMIEFFLYLHFARYWSLAGISMCSRSWPTICPRLRIDVCLRKTIGSTNHHHWQQEYWESSDNKLNLALCRINLPAITRTSRLSTVCHYCQTGQAKKENRSNRYLWASKRTEW